MTRKSLKKIHPLYCSLSRDERADLIDEKFDELEILVGVLYDLSETIKKDDPLWRRETVVEKISEIIGEMIDL